MAIGGLGCESSFGGDGAIDRITAWVLCLVSAASISLSACGLHGFSLTRWQARIGGDATEGVVWGFPPAIRSDDRDALLPLSLSQREHRPRFAMRSRLLGFEEVDTLASYAPLPVWHWVTVLRPQVWGYFVGTDVGVAWHWWSRILLLFVSTLLWFRLLARGRPWLAVGGAALVVVSPFFQFHAFYQATGPAAFACLLMVATAGLIDARSKLGAAACAVGSTLFALGFALNFIYPGFQIPLAYGVLAFGLGWWAEGRRRRRHVAHGRLKLALVVCAGVAVAAALGLFYLDVSEGITRLLHTSYPGDRRVPGGGLSAGFLFTHDLLLFDKSFDWSRGIWPNQTGGSGFLYLSPVVALVLLQARRTPSRVQLAMFLYLAVLVLWALVGWPSAVAAPTLMDRVLEMRVLLPMGLFDAGLLVSFLGAKREVDRPSWLGVFGWAAILLLPAIELIQVEVPGVAWQVVPSFLVMLFAAQLVRTRSRWVLPLLICVSAWGAIGFNPLVRGGASRIQESELGRIVRELDRARGRDTLWISFGSQVMGNFFRMVGVRAVGGLHIYPEFSLWEKLDPQGLAFSTYNRFAHVGFMVGKDRRSIGIVTDGAGNIIVRVHPTHPRIAELGVDFALVQGAGRRAFEEAGEFELVAEVGANSIYAFSRGVAAARPGPRRAGVWGQAGPGGKPSGSPGTMPGSRRRSEVAEALP